MEAGCRKKEWIYDGTIPVKYHWNSTGNLLATGVCIRDDYQKYFPPEERTTKVYSTISNPVVRKVGAKEKTISLDFELKLQWIDSRIRANLPHGEITLDPNAIEKIWSPDLRILNRQFFNVKDKWASLIKTRILTGTVINDLDGKNYGNYGRSIPTIEMKYDVKTTVYCKDWTYTKYPMDNQTCRVMFGSASASSIFTLHQELITENSLRAENSFGAANFSIDIEYFDQNETNDNTSHQKSNSYNNTNFQRAVNFDIEIEYFDQNKADGTNQVGIKITMQRVTTSFVLKYYAPCVAIVLVSGIGFTIPVTAIPGRVGLLVTQFLTLINLFIHQMVSNFCN